MSISYVVVKTTEKEVSNEKREVTAVIEKISKLKLHLGLVREVFLVSYPVWGDTHMTNLAEAIYTTKKIDNISRIGISKALKAIV